MARGRMLNRKISQDENVAKLSVRSALLYTWIIPHADIKGRVYGDKIYLKGNIVPHIEEIEIDDIEKLLLEMVNANLIYYYGDKVRYIELCGWKTNQTLHPDREAQSEIPPPTKELMIYSCVNPAKEKLREVKISKEKIVSKRQDTPLQIVVNHFKVKKGFPKDDKVWDRTHYTRNSRSAKQLIDFCGSAELACACIDSIAAEMDKIKFSWTIETIVKHSADWKLNHSKKAEEERKKQEEVKKAEEFAKGMI